MRADLLAELHAAVSEGGEERLMEMLGELEGDELAEAVAAITPAAATVPVTGHDGRRAGGAW